MDLSQVWLRRLFIVDVMQRTNSRRHLEGSRLTMASRINQALGRESERGTKGPRECLGAKRACSQNG